MLGCLCTSVWITVIDLVLLTQPHPAHTQTQNKNPPVSIICLLRGISSKCCHKETLVLSLGSKKAPCFAPVETPTQPQTVTVNHCVWVINHANTSATFWNSVRNHQWRHKSKPWCFITSYWISRHMLWNLHTERRISSFLFALPLMETCHVFRLRRFLDPLVCGEPAWCVNIFTVN